MVLNSHSQNIPLTLLIYFFLFSYYSVAHFSMKLLLKKIYDFISNEIFSDLGPR